MIEHLRSKGYAFADIDIIESSLGDLELMKKAESKGLRFTSQHYGVIIKQIRSRGNTDVTDLLSCMEYMHKELNLRIDPLILENSRERVYNVALIKFLRSMGCDWDRSLLENVIERGHGHMEVSFLEISTNFQ